MKTKGRKQQHYKKRITLLGADEKSSLTLRFLSLTQVEAGTFSWLQFVLRLIYGHSVHWVSPPPQKHYPPRSC